MPPPCMSSLYPNSACLSAARLSNRVESKARILMLPRVQGPRHGPRFSRRPWHGRRILRFAVVIRGKIELSDDAQALYADHAALMIRRPLRVIGAAMRVPQG